MKNLLISILLLASVTVFAQQQGNKRATNSNEQMATLQAKRLAMQLDLNEQQEEKIKLIFAKRIEARSELKAKNGELRKERTEMNSEQKSELREILTEEQFLKWEQLQEKRRKGRKAPMRESQN
ncbi:MAG: hypothetical protein WB492_15235 [Christiangramia sp.]